MLGLVLRNGVNVPFWDQWEIAGALVRLRNGTGLSWSDLFDQHNEHRMVFPKLVMVVLALATGWDTRAELLAGVAIMFAALAVFVRLMRPALARSGAATRIWAAFTVSMILFSLAQWENWLWGWQIQWFLSVLAFVSSTALAAWSGDRARPWTYLGGAIAAAVVCQFSLASGVLAWATGALILASHRRPAPLVVWLACAVGATAAYLHGYAPPLHHPSPLTALAHPDELAAYVAAYLSGPLGRGAGYGLSAFGAFVALSAMAFRRSKRAAMPWVAVGLYAIGSAVLTAVGRAGFGAAQGLASRYVTIALLLTVALVPLGVLALGAPESGRWSRLRTVVAAGAGLALTAMVATTTASSVARLVEFHRHLDAVRSCVLRMERADVECLQRAHPNPVLVRRRVKQLATLGWSVTPPPDGLLPGALHADGALSSRRWRLRVDDRTVGAISEARIRDGALVVSGWVHDPLDRQGPARVLVIGDGVVLGEAEAVGDQRDVAAATGEPKLARRGWTVRADAGRPPRIIRAFLREGERALVPLDGDVASP